MLPPWRDFFYGGFRLSTNVMARLLEHRCDDRDTQAAPLAFLLSSRRMEDDGIVRKMRDGPTVIDRPKKVQEGCFDTGLTQKADPLRWQSTWYVQAAWCHQR